MIAIKVMILMMALVLSERRGDEFFIDGKDKESNLFRLNNLKANCLAVRQDNFLR